MRFTTSFLFAAKKDSSEKNPAVAIAPQENKFQKRRKLEELNKRYQSRVTIARLGQESMAQKDYMNAIKYYNQYLKIIADIHEVEIYELSPALFGQEKLLKNCSLVIFFGTYAEFATSALISRENYRKIFQCT